MFTWHVKPGNTSIMHSEPPRFIITEMVGETQRVITMHDRKMRLTTYHNGVIDAILFAEAVAKPDFEPRNFMEQPD